MWWGIWADRHWVYLEQETGDKETQTEIEEDTWGVQVHGAWFILVGKQGGR